MVQNKVRLVKYFNVQPSELERMPFWEYEEFINAAEELIEEEKEQQEEASGEYNNSNYMKDAKSMMRQQQRSFKQPSLPKLNMPKI